MMRTMKQHFDVLDGLRGTAALLVVIFHLLEVVFPAYVANPLRHAYLAVDFFFLLSGFVVGYAYDERWPALRVRDFLRLRLVRLHPLVLLSTVIGGLCYYFDPFVGQAQRVNELRLTAAFVLGALLLPGPPLPNRADLTHPLNSPGWSLLQEYLINIVYALVGSRLSRRGLLLLVALSAVALTGSAAWHWNLHGGWAWNTWWMAPIRVAFPFWAGLLVYREGWRVRLPHAYAWLSGLLLLVFAAPASRVNGYYEAGCVLVVFPVIVAAGAGSQSTGWLKKVCRLSGQLSYPLYLVHFPFVQVFGHWITATHPTGRQLLGVASMLVLFFLGLAWVALHWYDEPVRAWLTARNKRKHQPALGLAA
jgi:peptidoglycan/LPS O-acetylase OafA/YrhL